MGNDCLGKSTTVQTAQSISGKYNVVVICGSLKQKSLNKGLLQAINKVNHPKFNFILGDISNFVIFDEDLEARGIPTDVKTLRRQVHDADAVLFGIPEYNFSISAPMKNAYDWLSREYAQSSDPYEKKSPVQEKIGAMVSVAYATGGVKAQEHFQHSVSYRKMKILPPTGPAEFRIKGYEGKKFDENGNLIDLEVIARINPFLNAFASFIDQNLVKK